MRCGNRTKTVQSLCRFSPKCRNFLSFRFAQDEIEARVAQQLPTLLHTAAVVSLGPDPSTGSGRARRGRGRLPRVNIHHAIRINRIKGPGAGGGRRGGIRPDRRVASKEELEKELAKLLGMVKRCNRKTRLAQGWTEAGEDVWIPPARKTGTVGTRDMGTVASDCPRAGA